MKYLLHFKCDVCGWKWSVYCESMISALNSIADEGCPKQCGNFGKIYLMGHEKTEDNTLLEMIGCGIGAVCKF
ncbi:hypothetical protein DAMNIGENAA_13540 [Desulforhabdus amnigena]|uniref:Uncharacterized protein n=1 Tax=Desulforhabdus amnigena TaxID=40218 RepID=A0A9W6FTR1_9BACT|nr:hypothetical protein DAMNIGENAA_13540 [Desulforhabdus amnigena]